MPEKITKVMNDRPGIIYGLVDGESLELRYVGQTTRPLEKRFAGHKYNASRGHTHLDNWINSTHINVIILERAPANLDEAEIRWIREMQKQGARLLNLTEGGAGGKPSLETRAKMRSAQLGKIRGPCSIEPREKISVAQKGRSVSSDCRAKISVALKGRRFSAEHRAKIGAAMLGNQYGLGYRHTPETLSGMIGRQNTLGHTLTSEHRAKISSALQTY